MINTPAVIKIIFFHSAIPWSLAPLPYPHGVFCKSVLRLVYYSMLRPFLKPQAAFNAPVHCSIASLQPIPYTLPAGFCLWYGSHPLE